MAKPRVTLKFDMLKRLIAGDYFGSGDQRLLGETVRDMSLESISKGLSPVRGVGRFVSYRAQTASAKQPKRPPKLRNSRAPRGLSRFYPYSVLSKFPHKTIRPVNLKLSGEFLETLTFRGTKNGIEFGHLEFSGRTKDLFEAHNEGMNSKNNVPQRKYLPNKPGEDFIVSIMRAIKDIYARKIKSIINSNR